MSLKTILGWAAVAFIVWFVVESPSSAGHIVVHAGHFIATAGSGLAHFVSTI